MIIIQKANVSKLVPFLVLMCLAACTNNVSEQNINVKALAVSTSWEKNVPEAIASSLIDFSSVGVNYSTSGISDLALPIFSVTDFGAIANDEHEDKQAIINAIHAAEKAEGGVVFFPPGRFLINEQPRSHSIVISHSRIILRGSGSGEQGTELFMRHALEAANPAQKWTVPSMIKFSPVVTKPTAKSIIISNAKQYEMSVEVLHPEKFYAGDVVIIDMQNPAANDEFLYGKKPRFNWLQVIEKGVRISETLEVSKVEGKRIYFKQPLITNIDTKYGWTIRAINSLNNVGIENLRFTGNFLEKFIHHKNALHDSGFSAVQLKNTTHSWVRNVVFSNVAKAANISGGVANTMMLNVIEGNRGHASFDITFGTRNLVALNLDITNEGQWHGPGSSHTSVANVFWRFNSPKSRGIDSHGGFPRFTLFDNITSNGFGGWGGNYKNLPNHLEGLVFWNFKQTGETVGEWHKDKFNFWDINAPKDQPYTFFSAVNPILVGYEGSATGYLEQHVGHVESFGKHVLPESLYEIQLEQRLGQTPQWMKSALLKWQKQLVKYSVEH